MPNLEEEEEEDVAARDERRETLRLSECDFTPKVVFVQPSLVPLPAQSARVACQLMIGRMILPRELELEAGMDFKWISTPQPLSLPPPPSETRIIPANARDLNHQTTTKRVKILTDLRQAGQGNHP